MVCDDIVDGWFPPVHRQRLPRDVAEDDDEAVVMDKRSFSHTSLPLPSRIQFMLKVKNAFCTQVKAREANCIKRAVKRAMQKKKSEDFVKWG